MTKQLRNRIMIILMLLLSTTFIAIIIAINISLDRGNRNMASESLQFLMQRESRPGDAPGMSPDKAVKDNNQKYENNLNNNKKTDTDVNNTNNDTNNEDGNTQKEDGNRPPEIPNDDKIHDNRHIELSTSHYILVKYSKDNTLESIDNSLSDSYSDEDIEDYCKDILQNNRKEGTVDQLRYMVRENKDNIIIIFIDHSLAVQSAKNLRIISIIASIFAVIIFALLSYVLSGWMVKPVDEAFEKQKQFISDASHELKTPITVILSNSELLEDQIGENKQLSYIKKECDQMHYLVTSLLTLTRMEQTPYKDVEKNDFCISDTLLERIMPMESIAFEKGVLIDYDNVTPDVHFYGVKEQIGQVATILLDNAITHTEQGGTITIRLSKTPHHIHFSVANTGQEIPADVREKLFERFYRADESRHRSSGHFGLGLSIAKTIVTNHRGKINVDCSEGVTTFSASFRIR